MGGCGTGVGMLMAEPSTERAGQGCALGTTGPTEVSVAPTLCDLELGYSPDSWQGCRLV